MLALWGASYAWGCLQALAGPAGPVENFELATPGGKVFVHLDSYSIDLANNRAMVRGLLLRGPAHETLASADELIVEPALPMGEGASIKVRGHGVFARLVLDATGRPLILKLLPESDERPSTSVYAVDLRDARLECVGTGTGTPWHASATIGHLTVNGAGERWVAAADTHWGKGGDASILARGDARGFAIEGTLARLEAAPFLAYYGQTEVGRSLDGLEKLHAGSLVGSGPFRVSVPRGGAVGLWSDLDLLASNVRFDDLHADVASAHGLVTRRGFEGRVELAEGPNRAVFDGSALWDAAFEAAGKLAVTAPSPRALPRWAIRSVPEGLDFQNGTFDGWVRWSHDQPRFQGRFTARAAQWGAESLADPTADLDADAKLLSVRLRSGKYLGAPVSGSIRADLVGGALLGALAIDGLDVARVAAKGKRPGWHGTMRGTALVSGTVGSPALDMRLRGDLAFDRSERDGLQLGAFTASARWGDGVFRLRQGSLVGPLGAATAEGSWTPRSGAVAGEIFGGGWALDALVEGVQGTGAFAGTVAGTLDEPRIAGRAEVYGLEVAGQTIPLIVAEITGDRKQVVATRLEAAKGSARSSGSVGLRWADGALFGEVKGSGFQLAEWFGEDVGGAVDLDRFAVSGTVDKPLLEAELSSKGLVAYGVRIDSGRARVTADRDDARLETIELVSDGGSVLASGGFDFATREGFFAGDAEHLPLARLLATHFDAVDVEGGVGGHFSGHVTPDGLADLVSSGTLSDVGVNGVPFGGGSWNMRSELGVWFGDAMLGQLERFVEVPHFSYSQPDRSVFVEVTAYQMGVDDLEDVVRRYVPSLTGALADRLDTVEGTLDGHATAQGRIEDADLDFDVLEVSQLALGGRDLGRVDVSADRREGVWNLQHLDWTGGPGTLAMSGRIAPGGDLAIDGELSNFDLSVIGAIDPSLSRLRGQIEKFSFLGSGRTESPEFAATLKGFVGVEPSTPEAAKTFLDVNLDSIALAGDRFNAGGKLTYAGVRADLLASLPFGYPFTVPADQPFEVSLTLPPRDMTAAEMADVPLPLDPASKISVEGGVRAHGTFDAYQVTGSAKLSAPQVALKGGQTALKGLDASAVLNDQALALDVRAQSSQGGGFLANVATAGSGVQTRLAEFAKKFGDDPQAALEELWTAPVLGSIAIDQLRVRHDAGVNGFADVTAGGSIAVSGTVRSPLLQGEVAIAKANVILPSEPLETSSKGLPLVNPRFDLRARFLQPATMRAGTSTMDVLGDGQLVGTLVAPDLSAALSVVRGSVRLPNARVALEPGGTLQLRYQGSEAQLATARLDVDLEGRTNVTALRFGNQVERYSVTVFIGGDLLKDGGVRMTAESDPPDLDSDRILMLLGQADLFEGLASVFRPEGRGQFQSALTSLAVPALFDPITERLAQSLGLDYLSLEYNALDQTTIAAAKSLGRGLMLSGRRQISDPSPGFLQRFDFRLSYRLPVRNRLLARTTIVVGVDQDRPWKIAIEYGIRF